MIANVKSVVAWMRESAEDRSVLEWSCDEAVSRGADLRIVLAREVSASYLTLGAASVPLQRRRPPAPVADDASRRLIDWAVEYVRNRHGDALTVDGEAIVGDTTDALIAESRRASVLVLGAHRRGRRADTSQRMVKALSASGPECLVVVVPSTGDWSPRAGAVIHLRRRHDRSGDQPEAA